MMKQNITFKRNKFLEMKRRIFIKNTTLGGIGLSTLASALNLSNNLIDPMQNNYPVTIATRNFPNASIKAGQMLAEGAKALDAVEQGVMVEEANLKN